MGNNPAISVILPVLNEADTINSAVAHLRELESGDRAEIIVVDGNQRGSTIHGIRDRTISTAISEKGRALQMNCGAASASGAILLFLHADTLLPPNALSLIASTMKDDRFVAGAFDLGINTSRRIFRITERYVAIRTRMTDIPFGDQAIFIRREYFEKIGGFKPIPIMEDVELMRRIKKRGDRIRIIPEKVMTSARRWEEEGVLYATFRNWMLQAMYCCGVPPKRLARFYRS